MPIEYIKPGDSSAIAIEKCDTYIKAMSIVNGSNFKDEKDKFWNEFYAYAYKVNFSKLSDEEKIRFYVNYINNFIKEYNDNLNIDDKTKVNSYLVKLEVLNSQYKTKLIQYESAYATYISALNDNTINSQTNSYVVLPGKIYTGVEISKNTNSSISQCEASCSANKSCNGASFNSINNTCTLQSGNGILSKSAQNDNAIITKMKEQIINLEIINSQMIEINNQITNTYKLINPLISTYQIKLDTNENDLLTQNSLLMTEREKIKHLLDEYNDINQNNINQTLFVEQSNSSYYLWFIICIISIILVIKTAFFPNVQSKMSLLSIILWSILFICVILSTVNLNNPIAYAIWLILIIIILMMKSNLIPSI